MNIDHTTIVLLLSALGGSIGGITNFALIPDKQRNKDWYKDIGRSMITGFSAGLVVPLFLFIIRSELMERSKDDTQYYLAIFGFGVLAGLFSKIFLESMAAKALRLAEEANKKADEADERTKNYEESVTEPDKQDVEATREIMLSPDEEKVLKVFPSQTYRFRSLHGLGKTAGMHPQDLRRTLDRLIEKSLLKEVVRAEGRRFLLTNSGSAYLGKSAEAVGSETEPSHGGGRPRTEAQQDA